jgi:isoquinoline 1-oxidoreductase alpha subunit
MLMAATDLLTRTPHPDDATIDAAMTNICRCGTYARIKEAIHRVANGKESSPFDKKSQRKRTEG